MPLLREYNQSGRDLPSTIFAQRSAGFTLIELLITSAILIIIVAGGSIAAVNQYQNYSLLSDKNTLLSVLQQARSRAMNNVDQTTHGVSIQPGYFVIFEGATYATRNTSVDENISRSALVTETGLQEITFTQLEGKLSGSGGDFILSNGQGNKTINVNNEGRIN